MRLDEDFGSTEDEVKLLLSKPQFHKDIISLRSKWKIPCEGYKTNTEWNAWNDNLTSQDRDELQADIYGLIATYELSERWVSALRQYLLDNVHTRLRNMPYTAWRFDYEGDAANPQNIQAVWIKVDADTTQREVKEALSQAKKMLPRKRKKQAYTYLDHALRAKELKNPETKWSSVTKQVNEEFGTNYDENYVIKMVSRLDAHL